MGKYGAGERLVNGMRQALAIQFILQEDVFQTLARAGCDTTEGIVQQQPEIEYRFNHAFLRLFLLVG